MNPPAEFPLSLTDDQLNAVFRAAAILHHADGDHFLRLVALGLRNAPELDDGIVHRVARSVMCEVLRARPIVEHEERERTSKYSREWIRRSGEAAAGV